MKVFVRDHNTELGTAARTVKQAIESTEANLAWMKLNYETIWGWLKKQNEKHGVEDDQIGRSAFWEIIGI